MPNISIEKLLSVGVVCHNFNASPRISFYCK